MARGSPTSPNSPLSVSPQGFHTMYQNPPLMNIHEIFLQAAQRAANIKSAQDVVIISGDSSLQPANSFGSFSGGSISDGAWLSDHQPGRTSDNEFARATNNEPARALDNV
ncbi:hypothetical protein ACFE04_002081 [Oxalis oulophora]